MTGLEKSRLTDFVDQHARKLVWWGRIVLTLFGLALISLLASAQVAAFFGFLAVATMIVPVWLLPFFLVFTDNSLHPFELVVWLVGFLFFSCFLWLLYIFITPVIEA